MSLDSLRDFLAALERAGELVRVPRPVSVVPAAGVACIWLVAPVRRGEREWGGAVVARRAAGGRVRVYTAGYALVIRGRERGQGRVRVLEVGESRAGVVD